MRKRIVSLVVALASMLSYCICPVAANTEVASGTCGKNISWTLDGEGTLTITGNGRMDNYQLGATSVSPFSGNNLINHVVITNGVQNIGNNAFVACENLTTATILANIDEIGDKAFYACSNLYCINLPDSLKKIGVGAFLNCSNLSNIVLPTNLESIESNAFQGTNISNIVLPKKITEIGASTFAECHNLKTVSLPKSIKRIELAAFTNSFTLTDLYYEGTQSDWNAVYKPWENDRIVIDRTNGTNWLKDTTIHFQSYITVCLNGREIAFSQPPVVIAGRTLVPLRAIFEAMGATVDWDNNTQTVTSTLDSTTIQLTIGSNVLHKNGIAVTLDVPAQLINGYTMVPVRAIAEAFGADVDWDDDTQTVYITTKGNTYTVNTIPQIACDGYDANFANFNGMYIDSFTHSTNNNGSENVKFDVYNTAYIYGIVEVYDQNDNLTDVAIIDKMSNASSIKGVLIDNTGRLIKDLWNGTALTYRQESGYSKKTSINIDIPKNGYIKITNDMNDSFVASVINLSDIVFGAKKTFSTLNGFNSNTSKEYVSELSAKIIKEAAFAEMIKNPTKYTEKLWKGVVKELYMNPESVGGFLDTVSKNLDEFADGELSKLMLSTATDCGIGIAEGTFEALAGPAGVALKAMFAITSVTDILIEMNDGLDCLYQGSIRIKTV